MNTMKHLGPYLRPYWKQAVIAPLLMVVLIKLRLSKSGIAKESINEKKTVLENLKNSENYGKEFNRYISKVIQGSIYLSPDLQN